MHPAKEPKLLLEVALFQRHDKAHEPDGVEHEADHAMIGGERKELRISEHDVLFGFQYDIRMTGDVDPNLEIVYDALPIEEIVGDGKEVPIKGFAPDVLLGVVRNLWAGLFFEGEQRGDFAIDDCLADHDENDHVSVPEQQQTWSTSQDTFVHE